jgi:UDP-2-acetamido-3-amino-2,3-dideoxy-glucuronate N-acetyltransferase
MNDAGVQTVTRSAAATRREPTPADVRVHPTALVEPGVLIGAGTAIWDNVHIRAPAMIGRECIIGEKTYIAYGVTIGDFVKINAQVYVCTGIAIEDQVMIAANVIFTNDRYPRAFADDGLAPSGPTADTLSGRVRRGATIGAAAVIGPGLEIGAHAMVGMGAVVTTHVPPHALVLGNPARIRAWVCVCGRPLAAFASPFPKPGARASCGSCGSGFVAARVGSAVEIRRGP